MPLVTFEALPDDGRLWVFPLGRALDPSEVDRVLERVDGFLESWAAHGVPLRCARSFVEGRFLVVGVDVHVEAPSGCSIDALTNHLSALGEELGTTFVHHLPVWFREGEAIRCVNRAEFRALVAQGVVGTETAVFDTTLTRVEAYRSGALERPAASTWHGKAFFRESPAGR
ncbi:MAG: hypothetical protein OEZ65_04265 [Gemmatimonadota bacterium]|nr:hypothetical protein [Gemmatimonadota bacterium]MDH5758779.1 hypothetical protein [Gemmatimonadota bacterium]